MATPVLLQVGELVRHHLVQRPVVELDLHPPRHARRRPVEEDAHVGVDVLTAGSRTGASTRNAPT